MRSCIQYRVYLLTAIFAFVCACLLAPFLVHAQTGNFVPLAETPGGKLAELYSSPDLSGFINGLFKFGIALGAIIAVLRLAYAGYLYMGQSDMWSHKGEARTIIADVTLGLLILLSIYLILFQINPDIVQFKALDVIKSAPASSGQQNVYQGPIPAGEEGRGFTD
ncbi:hypothetical protein A2763_00220 [Candidatus Kaiserbacteria bacterium RIFCSPHIGHO2_01_FULL_54_36]|uniref:Uncharacterized protein n=1 Tax=Candidatus Kaiserbacteria bacterium RIFCSPHIGHO2_01_FULL_54_36 TaxID=1798482 RepID=A0A1F6CPA5_9BACT|nr:MAG: hypothetical protein A2763_00220 [Candidatus Kaiserbacteria bacterium RIFCSPHIGHO2_01_FULL_54_36]OGG75215.1 MAG: hypothetical protein A3A41_03765 [Candidatus Kaiserbacteria bacterium RIFCSPLOWO2_01_FULL_54_22]